MNNNNTMSHNNQLLPHLFSHGCICHVCFASYPLIQLCSVSGITSCCTSLPLGSMADSLSVSISSQRLVPYASSLVKLRHKSYGYFQDKISDSRFHMQHKGVIKELISLNDLVTWALHATHNWEIDKQRDRSQQLSQRRRKAIKSDNWEANARFSTISLQAEAELIHLITGAVSVPMLFHFVESAAWCKTEMSH